MSTVIRMLSAVEGRLKSRGLSYCDQRCLLHGDAQNARPARGRRGVEEGHVSRRQCCVGPLVARISDEG